MFKHILLPTDGTEFSEAAIDAGLQFAKGIGAKVTGFFVKPELHTFSYQVEVPEETQALFERECKAHVDQVLANFAQAAISAGVVYDQASATSDHPYQAIVKAATEKGCDLILMASHGRKGVQGLLLGSETQKVLTHTKIPVLVYR